MLDEIMQIPAYARQFIEKSPAFVLPTGTPYLGMGSSYFSCLAFKYMGVDIYPETAAEYYYYLSGDSRLPMGVLLSQSGKSSETLWCRERFSKYIAVTNDRESPLASYATVENVVELYAGTERFSSSKTYFNTLLALFKGFGLDQAEKIARLSDKMDNYNKQGKELAEKIFDLIQRRNIAGFYITGAGPNVATALQAALILSETTKLGFQGMSLGQYDHGPKETAANSIVIQVVSRGKEYERSKKTREMIRAAGADVFVVEEPDADEFASVLYNIIPFNFLGYYLSGLLGVKETFVVGKKITEVK